ncbi:GxxExxY protein [Gemmatimonas aurantiaca]|uniref:GxxExxY protein n=1 Tax=Gemmatimonas aurantiaca TaxID=173480 RepID=UPI00301E2CB6
MVPGVLKACKQLVSAHEAQVLNYLRASGIEVGLLFNFGPQPEMRRMIWMRDRRALSSSDR